jgi:maltooligosyltrehalose trehalohydrolase
VLDWTGRTPAQDERLRLVTELLALRAGQIVPRLKGAVFGDAAATDTGLVTAHWIMGDGAVLRLVANLSDREITHSGDSTGTPIWGGADGNRLSPWSVVWRLGG